MTALHQPLPIRLEASRVHGEQALAEATGPTRALRTLVAEPDRHPLLHGCRRHPAVGPDAAELAHPLVGHGVAPREAGAEQLVLGHAVAGAEAELEPTVAHEVDDRRLLGQLHRVVQRGDRGRERERLGEVPVVEEVVLREPHGVRAETFGLLAQLQGEAVEARGVALPLGRVAEVEVDTDVHRFP